MHPFQFLSYLNLLAAFCGVVLVCQYARTKKRKLPPPPPGPRPLPLIGNLLDLPATDVPVGEHWAMHKALYGTNGPNRLDIQGLNGRQVPSALSERSVQRWSLSTISILRLSSWKSARLDIRAVHIFHLLMICK